MRRLTERALLSDTSVGEREGKQSGILDLLRQEGLGNLTLTQIAK